MSAIRLFGYPQSTYVRVARLACTEKGVDYELEGVDIGSEDYRGLHPFHMMPAMQHGDFHLWETSAICRYVDEAFDGPPLTPADAKGRARMEQWICAFNAYIDPAMIRQIVWQRLVVPSRGEQPDEEIVAAATPKVDYQLSVVDTALSETDYLAGDTISIADFFLLPALFYFSMTPEGQEALPGYRSVGAWFDRMQKRESFAATLPPVPDAAE